MKHVIALSLALLAAPAFAGGFSAADLAKAAATAETAPGELRRETEALRLAIAYDSAAGIGTRAEAEQEALSIAFGTGDARGDARAQWFMAGAIAQPARGDFSLLYNPLARGWLALAWVRTANGWRVAAAELKSAGEASWPTSDEPYRKLLAADYAAMRATPPQRDGALVGVEADKWLAGLAFWLRKAEFRAASDATRALIAEGKTAKLGSTALDLLPTPARAAFAPVAAIGRKDGGAMVVFGSPLQPHLLVTADYDSAARPRLERLNLINLDNAGARP